MSMKRYELTKEQWERIKSLLPPEEMGKRGRPRKDNPIMFYSASNRIADSRRSMGLGLALCKSIITAHGGEITVADHAPHGTVFTFTIPIEEVELHE